MADPNSARDATEFWAFSLDFYARPGVAETCLRLQDAHGLDVNLLLLCCWLGSSGRGRLDAAALAAAEASVAPWRETVIVPLRTVRRALKRLHAGLYETVKRAERDAEREEQALLIAFGLGNSAGALDRVADATANLILYFTAHDLAIAAPTALIRNL